MANELLVEDDIVDGTLAKLEVRPKGYYLTADASRWDEPAIRKTREWLRRHCAIEKPFVDPRSFETTIMSDLLYSRVTPANPIAERADARRREPNGR